mmetsp:Transcript_54190/g.158217  ORF Transcript_54190/g.158217 Transcript_54190/m.158217 type:complete len:211 (+) Transcript_54190:1207-1839(+)
MAPTPRTTCQTLSLLLTEKPSHSTVSGSHSRCCTSISHTPLNFGSGASSAALSSRSVRNTTKAEPPVRMVRKGEMGPEASAASAAVSSLEVDGHQSSSTHPSLAHLRRPPCSVAWSWEASPSCPLSASRKLLCKRAVSRECRESFSTFSTEPCRGATSQTSETPTTLSPQAEPRKKATNSSSEASLQDSEGNPEHHRAKSAIVVDLSSTS